MTKTIVFDLDGVLCNFIQPAIKKGYELAGADLPKDWVPTHWDDYGGMDETQIMRLWEYIKGNPSFWSELPPLVSVTESNDIVRLAHEGCRIYFATNRRFPGAYEATLEWLDMFMGFSHGLVITKRKGEFCRCVDADYYIDDKSENVDCAIWLTDGKTKSYVRDSPANRGQYAPHSSKAGRVHSVAEFIEEVSRG